MRFDKMLGRVAFCTMGLASIVCAQAPEEDSEAIDPQALEVLKQMSSFLTQQQSFTFKGEDAFDEILPSGQKVQFSNRRTITVVRPKELTGEVHGDTANRKVWFDGTTFALVNTAQNVFSTLEVSGTIDTLIEYMYDRFGVNFPLSDFLSGDPYRGMTEDLKTAVDLGVHQVSGVACRHLAFTQDDVDWQIWVDEGNKPLPRKLVITYKKEEAQPQYAWVFHEWNLSPSVSAEAFRFAPPDGAERIEMMPVNAKASEPKDDKEKSK